MSHRQRAAGDTAFALTYPGIKKLALSVPVECVHLVAGRLGFYSQSDHTKDFKNSIRSFRARRSAQVEVQRALCMRCSSCMSFNSVQSFVIENCNGPTIENGLNNVCLHPLSRTFTFYPGIKPQTSCAGSDLLNNRDLSV